MTSYSIKFLVAGSLGLLFIASFVLAQKYQPGSVVANIYPKSEKNQKMSPSDMVTPKVTLVTRQNVTNVTSLSPSITPTRPSSLSGNIGEHPGQVPDASGSPTVSPYFLVTNSPSPVTSQNLSPSSTVTPGPVLSPSQSGKININTASLNELDDIVGVGPVIAQRIIDYRSEHGPFQKIEDIVKVKGIGDATFQKMKDQITI